MAVGDLGQMAFVIDPGGAFIGAWQPGEHKGFRRASTSRTPPGGSSCTPVTRTRAVAFYREVFGWEIHVVNDAPEFRYTTWSMDDGAHGPGSWTALGFLPEGVPALWSVYFEVADADATLAKALEARRRRWCSPPRTLRTAGSPP